MTKVSERSLKTTGFVYGYVVVFVVVVVVVVVTVVVGFGVVLKGTNILVSSKYILRPVTM